MMRKISLTVLLWTLLFIISTPIIAWDASVDYDIEPPEYIISIDKPDTVLSLYNFNLTVQELRLSIFHDFGAAIIVAVNKDQIESLINSSINFSILTPLPADIYLVSNKKRAADITISPNDKLLYTHYGHRSEPPIHLIVSSPDEIIKYRNYKITPLTNPINYDNDIRKHLTYNPDILHNDLVANLAAEVDSIKIYNYIKHLQDYETRYFLNPNRREIVQWLVNQFHTMGINYVEVDSFYISQYKWGNFPPSWQYNVAATIPGSVYSDKYVVIGGHFDSIISSQYGNPLEIAPGADDNASGVAALLEIAGVLSSNNYQPKKSIKFIAFGAEEIGLYGSKNIAEKYDLLDYDIEIMINNDMIANKQSSDHRQIKIYPYSNALYISELAENIFSDFTSIDPVIATVNSPNSDSYSFYQHNYPSVFFHEYDFSQVYHSPDDTIEHCDVQYATEIVKASLMTMLYMDRVPTAINDLEIVDVGTGREIELKWDYNRRYDVNYYNILVRTEDMTHSTISTSGLTQIVPDLIEGVRYFISISAVNDFGYEGIAIEKSYVPQSIPQAPADFSVTPFQDHLVFTWLPNREHDIQGYHIYKSTTEEMPATPFISHHQETFYMDYDLERNRYYYYTVTAVDFAGNESPPTETLRTGLFSLDQGILIVNATPDGTGEYFFPTERELYHYYDSLLADYNISYLHLSPDKELTITDIGFYSTVILFNDSISMVNLDLSEIFAEYLKGGGRLILSGFKPLSLFGARNDGGNNEGTPTYFDENCFIYNNLNIQSAFHKFGSYFSSAHSESEKFPELHLKEEVYPAKQLINIIGMDTISEQNIIYKYGTNYSEELPAGAMIGSVVGVITEQTLTLSFPLSYLNPVEVKMFFKTLFRDDFNEDFWYPDNVHKTVFLLPNYPNPFNSTTTIPYYVGDEGNVSISIYNVKGQKVRDLFFGYSPAGRTKLSWDGKDDSQRTLPTGIYFTSIKQGNHSDRIKLLLLQ